jgi:hypothetical protein
MNLDDASLMLSSVATHLGIAEFNRVGGDETVIIRHRYPFESQTEKP